MKKGAFTLIELLVYLALLAGLCLMTFGLAARTYRFMLERTRVHHLFVRLMVTEDLMRRDLQCASPWPADWDTTRGDAAHGLFKQLTMTADGKPIERWVGYEVNGKGLHRREGVYATGSWVESTVALVDAQVVGFEMCPTMGPRGTVVGVTVRLKTKEKEHAMTVALRNRVLV